MTRSRCCRDCTRASASRIPTFELAFRALRDEPAGALAAHARARRLPHGQPDGGSARADAGCSTGSSPIWAIAIEDLGWLCVPAWRFSRPDRPAAGLGTREQLLAAYERHAGIEVDAAALRWWELAGTLRWGVICVMQAFVHLGRRDAIGRARRDRSPRVRGRVGPAGAARPRAESFGGASSLGPTTRRTPAAAAARPPHRGRAARRRARGARRRRAAPRRGPRRVPAARVAARDGDGRARARPRRRARGRAARPRSRRSGCATRPSSRGRSARGASTGASRSVLAALRALVRAKLEVANPAYLRAASPQA